MAEIGALNQITKSARRQARPDRGLPAAAQLAAAEGEVVAYMTKNKDWCSLPDDLVTKMTAADAKTAGIRRQGLRLRGQDEEDAAAAGRRPAAAASAAGRQAADRAAVSDAGPVPAMRPLQTAACRASRYDRPLGCCACAGSLAALRPAGADRPADRLAIAAAALLVGKRAWRPGGPRRAESASSRPVHDRRHRDARGGLDLQRHRRPRPRPAGRADARPPARQRPRQRAGRGAVPRRPGAGRARRPALLQPASRSGSASRRCCRSRSILS